MIKKTFMYNFIPSKAEEEVCKASNVQWQVSRAMVEVCDVFPYTPAGATGDPWQIRRSLSFQEVKMGKILVPFADAMEHVFRFWALCVANQVVMGQKTNVVVWDVTDPNVPKRYGACFEVLPSDDFVLTCFDLFKDRSLEIDDEIGLCWDYKGSAFQFKSFRKAIK